ncbi:MAG: hypothetical protein WC509_08730, partial [Candidatus Izemoplasmatales bacterium]
IIASFGTTFAWFTVSNTVEVGQMQINVKTDTSLLIRVYDGEFEGDPAQDLLDEESLLDAATYRNNLVSTDITATTEYSGLAGYRLGPVTAANAAYDDLDGQTLKTMDVITKALTTTTNANSPTGDFVELKFWLLSQVSNNTIYLSDLNISVEAATNDLDTQDNVIYAVNLALWMSQELATPVVNPALIFSTNPDYAFAFTAGMRGAADTPDEPTIAGPYTLTAGQRSGLLAQHSLFYGLDSASISSSTAPTPIAALDADTPSLITVRIYIEGWDAQTTNAILASKFNISFNFEIIE